jgi:hypothetical protein
MTVFKDLLSDELVQDFALDENTPFIHNQRPLSFQEAQFTLATEANQIQRLGLDLQIASIEEAVKLRDIFKVCGYNDMREVTALFNTPDTRILIFFTARPEILALHGSGFFPDQNLESLLAIENEQGSVFLNLDQSYELLKIQVKTVQDPE